jgi:hypothetical protein
MLFCLLQDEISKKCIYSITSVTHIMFQFIVIHILDINYNDRHQKILICINRAQSYFSRKGTCKVMISFLSVRCYISELESVLCSEPKNCCYSSLKLHETILMYVTTAVLLSSKLVLALLIVLFNLEL